MEFSFKIMHSPQSAQHLGSNVKLIEDDSDQLKLLILMVHELPTTCAREQKVRYIFFLWFFLWECRDAYPTLLGLQHDPVWYHEHWRFQNNFHLVFIHLTLVWDGSNLANIFVQPSSDWNNIDFSSVQRFISFWRFIFLLLLKWPSYYR